MFKFLCIYAVALFGALPDPDGWVTLDSVIQMELPDQGGEGKAGDPWVVFAKQLGSENVLLKFPEDPSYRTLPLGGFEAVSQSSDGVYTLKALPISEEGPQAQIWENLPKDVRELAQVDQVAVNSWDCAYKQDGNFVLTRFFFTSEHFYSLEFKSHVLSMENRGRFVDFFDVVS
jgi:hypothetical protein